MPTQHPQVARRVLRAPSSAVEAHPPIGVAIAQFELPLSLFVILSTALFALSMRPFSLAFSTIEFSGRPLVDVHLLMAGKPPVRA